MIKPFCARFDQAPFLVLMKIEQYAPGTVKIDLVRTSKQPSSQFATTRDVCLVPENKKWTKSKNEQDAGPELETMDLLILLG